MRFQGLGPKVNRMKATAQQLSDHLGLDAPLGPYDSRMWSADDNDKGLTCTAQVAVNAEGDEMDVTIDITHFTPKPDTPMNEQFMVFHIKQDINKKWSPDILRIKREIYHGKHYDWEKKACDLFVTVTASLARNAVPDFDELLERFFKAGDGFGSGTAGGGKRNPTIKPEQLLNPMKKF